MKIRNYLTPYQQGNEISMNVKASRPPPSHISQTTYKSKRISPFTIHFSTPVFHTSKMLKLPLSLRTTMCLLFLFISFNSGKFNPAMREFCDWYVGSIFFLSFLIFLILYSWCFAGGMLKMASAKVNTLTTLPHNTILVLEDSCIGFLLTCNYFTV